jgi:hypothetical protein
LAPAYEQTAIAGWNGVTGRIGTAANGTVTITDAVEGMGVGTTYLEYVSHRRLTNSTHGLMSVMLAATAMTRAAARTS